MNVLNFLSSIGINLTSQVFPGRYTARCNEPFVLFLVGMRINKLWAVHKWVPVMFAMIYMLTSLDKKKEKSLLHASTWFSWKEIMVVQYWNSYDELESFAQSLSGSHYKSWKNYDKSISPGANVGIWHETYLIDTEDFECIHVNMPITGLAKATEHVKITSSLESSRQRLKRYK